MSATATITRFARPVLLLAGSGISAIIPIATLSIATQTLGTSGQGVVALTLAVAAYAAQLTGAALIEGPLAAGEREPSLSWWLILPAAVGAALLAFGAVNMIFAATGVLLLYPVLELTRVSCVVRNQARTEARSAATIAAAAVAALLLSRTPVSGSAWAVLALGGFAAVLLRRGTLSGRPTRPAPKGIGRPIIAETAVTGSVQPLLVAVISAVLGPLAAVGFRALTSLGSLMSPALGFLRLRLLSHNAGRTDRIVALTLLVVFGVAVVVVGETPLLPALFGEAWEYSSYFVLIVLVAWRLVVAAATFPFAQLRREGRTTTVLAVRTVTSILLLVFSVAGAHWYGVTGAFTGLLLAEAISVLLYRWALARSDDR
uniref:hypothetical protein n=1 Tax=Paractinoplanes polyasparticus TaxID=2856853 RepID=UPI001C8568FC|nr:hypothetical protein [Actinoplanes polyasparticus]